MIIHTDLVLPPPCPHRAVPHPEQSPRVPRPGEPQPGPQHWEQPRWASRTPRSPISAAAPGTSRSREAPGKSPCSWENPDLPFGLLFTPLPWCHPHVGGQGDTPHHCRETAPRQDRDITQPLPLHPITPTGLPHACSAPFPPQCHGGGGVTPPFGAPQKGPSRQLWGWGHSAASGLQQSPPEPQSCREQRLALR